MAPVRSSGSFLSVLATLGLACAGPGGLRGREGALQASSERFNEALRWQRFDLCERLLAPELTTSFATRFVARETELRLTDVQVLGVTWEEDRSAATVRLRIRFTLLPSITERVATVDQRWEDRQAGWLLARMKEAGGPGGGPLEPP